VTDLGSAAQVATSVVVGVGSGVGAAVVTNRLAMRRYRLERLDALIPAARRIAQLYEWQGESHMGLRRSSPPEDEMKRAVAEFERFRHDLPPDVQRRLRSLDEDDLDQFDYGDIMAAAAIDLREWIAVETERRHRTRRWLHRRTP
jgi:hypothetical protein